MPNNASIHTSNKTLKTMEHLSINCQFLPAYSPSLAPVELFFRIVKNKLRKTIQSEGIWFKKLIDRVKIYNFIENSEKKRIQELRIEFIKNAKKTIPFFSK